MKGLCFSIGLEDKINTFAQGVETLEDRLTQAQARATQAEEKGMPNVYLQTRFYIVALKLSPSFLQPKSWKRN